MSISSEALLLQRLLQDDHAAWRELVEKYSGLLLAISRRTFASYGFQASSQDCEDAVAEVWQNLLQEERRLIRRSLQGGHLLPTLQVLTRNRSIDMMRRRKIVSVALTEEHIDAFFVEPENRSPHPDVVLLPQVLNGLNPKERTLVDLFFLQGKKYREMELLTAIPQNSIGPMLTRALLKMRRAITELASAGARE